MFSGIKDSLTSSAAKSMLSSRLVRYGNLTDLRIRSRERSIYAELLLEGEEVPVIIHVERYRILTKGPDHVMVMDTVAVSRPWLQNLVQDFLVGVAIPVPSAVLLALGNSEGELA